MPFVPVWTRRNGRSARPEARHRRFLANTRPVLPDPTGRSTTTCWRRERVWHGPCGVFKCCFRPTFRPARTSSSPIAASAYVKRAAPSFRQYLQITTPRHCVVNFTTLRPQRALHGRPRSEPGASRTAYGDCTGSLPHGVAAGIGGGGVKIPLTT